jgi:Transglutaminase-like superfamily
MTTHPKTPGLFLRAYLELLRCHRHITCHNFAALYESVRSCPIARPNYHTCDSRRVCEAIDLACVFYWTEVRCLQRSAAATRLLKRHGIPAQLVIGIQQLPLKSHAWVEVEGTVVNDKPYVANDYAVLDRC